MREPSMMLSVPRRVRIQDVARASGYSLATVSYVVNDSPGHKVAANTRARVLEAAHDLGYIPNTPARSLRQQKSTVVLVVVDIARAASLPLSFLHDLDGELATRGLVPVLHFHDRSVRDLVDVLSNLDSAILIAVDGLDSTDLETIRRISVSVTDVPLSAPQQMMAVLVDALDGVLDESVPGGATTRRAPAPAGAPSAPREGRRRQLR